MKPENSYTDATPKEAAKLVTTSVFRVVILSACFLHYFFGALGKSFKNELVLALALQNAYRCAIAVSADAESKQTETGAYA